MAPTQTGTVEDFPDDRTLVDAKQTLYSGLAFSRDGSHLYASMGSLTNPAGDGKDATGSGVVVYSFKEGKIAPERLIQLPLEQLDGELVTLGATSRTTIELAKMLLEEQIGVRPRYLTCPPDLPAMMLEAPAAVLIGDAALRATLHDGPRLDLDVHDMGAAWRDWTGLPMVFAVWAARRQFATDHPGLVKDVHDAFVRSREISLARVDEVAQSAARWEDFEASALVRYFRTLDFSLGERQLAGLAEFAHRVGPRIGLARYEEPTFADV